MLIYRITQKSFSKKLYAPGFAGRWNGAGRKVIYASESIPLAFMENMIRRKGLGFNNAFATMVIEVPDTLAITVIEVLTLDPGWRHHQDYSICQSIGNDWYDKGHTPLLKVPSAILPTNYNFVINSSHKDFSLIKLVDTLDLVPDEKIEDLLKKYGKH